MRTYLVSYDLANPAMNQPYLADAIMSLGDAWARPLANVWYLRTDGGQTVIENRLARLLDEHDGLLIQAVREDAAQSNVVAFPASAEATFPQDDVLDEPAPLRAAS
jgi:hypothetical protein